MAATLRSNRPRLVRANSTSSSLAGMEKPFVHKDTPPFKIYQDPVEAYLDQIQLNKPLPPTPGTPRRPSSVYSVQKDDRREDQHDLLPPSIYLAPTQYRSSTSRLPDPTPARPKLTREAQTHAAADLVLSLGPDHDKSPTPSVRGPSLTRDVSVDPLSIAASQHSSGKKIFTAKDLSTQRHTDSYNSIVLAPTPTLALTVPEQSRAEQQTPPPQMSGRISEVVDLSLVPSPLRINNSFEESERPPSRFSDSSSELESHRDGIRKSIKEIAHKAFHSRKESKDTDDTDWAAFTRFQERRSSTPRRRSRIGSYVGLRRESLQQQSISGMYDTLTSLTAPSKTAKPTPIATNAPPKVHNPRVKSPAIPLTPYQEMGPKAWETASKASKKTSKSEKTKSNGASHLSLSKHDETPQVQFSTPVYSAPLPIEKSPKPRSMVNKLASAFSNGTTQVESAVGLNTARVKRTKSEKRREELKRKIKVIGLGQSSGDRGQSDWL
ncbi:MAG: hypothetical protein LQ348_003174 [Seirophora lacunosa]|nr:MAG: hypothetical protein LQ348_003174 [Seirophora lacunosa]